MENIYISPLACSSLKTFLYSHGFKVNFIKKGLSEVYDAISTHADIHMCQLGLWENSDIFFGNTEKLKTPYAPGNTLYITSNIHRQSFSTPQNHIFRR